MTPRVSQKSDGISVGERRRLLDGNPFGFRDRAAHPQEFFRSDRRSRRYRGLSIGLDENPRVRNDPQYICVHFFRNTSDKDNNVHMGGGGGGGWGEGSVG